MKVHNMNKLSNSIGLSQDNWITEGGLSRPSMLRTHLHLGLRTFLALLIIEEFHQQMQFFQLLVKFTFKFLCSFFKEFLVCDLLKDDIEHSAEKTLLPPDEPFHHHVAGQAHENSHFHVGVWEKTDLAQSSLLSPPVCVCRKSEISILSSSFVLKPFFKLLCGFLMKRWSRRAAAAVQRLDSKTHTREKKF